MAATATTSLQGDWSTFPAGVDTMTGGAGADTFEFGDVSHSGVGVGNRDLITDFEQAEGDKIDLSSVGDLVFIGTTDFVSVNLAQGELRYFHQGFGLLASTIVEADFNDDNVADFQIYLAGTITLVAGDFIL